MKAMLFQNSIYHSFFLKSFWYRTSIFLKLQLELCGLDKLSEGINDDIEEDLVSVYVGKENYSISVIGGMMAIRNSSGV